ncbi:MAG: hypothetical protein U0263_35325 [Polyangiaceae bacterium]
MSDDEILGLISKVFPRRSASGFNVFDYVHAEGSPAIALLYARLCWPEFAEFEDMVFLKESVEDDDDRARIRQALDKNEGDRTKTEQAFNCLDFEEIFGSRVGDTTVRESLLLAQRLREMWQAKLERTWPSTQFKVEIVQSEPNEESIALQFWRERTPQ